MQIDIYSLVLALVASILSGAGTAIIANIKDNKKEAIRQAERHQDNLKLEVKELKIKLYELERDLTDWKDKYYSAIQELISVKADLEETLIKLSLINMEIEND